MGTALIIVARKARYIGIVFRNPLAVGVGLISYSLYLAHWPLFVFYQYYHLGKLENGESWARPCLLAEAHSSDANQLRPLRTVVRRELR
jgi:peptidoglycan/LPS O-acetylase OafA/YrhL